jgi:CheY-like chemotaxis protein
VPSLYRLIVVQHDRADVMRAILDCPQEWPVGTAVVFDRRRANRRVRVESVPVERRSQQRRSEPDADWRTRGYIVAEVVTLPPQAAILRRPDTQPPDSPPIIGGALVYDAEPFPRPKEGTSKASARGLDMGRDRWDRQAPMALPKPATILIVEDHDDSRDAMGQIVAALGYRPVLARNGAEALRLVHDVGPDLILCDVRMPGMDGFAFAQAVRSQPGRRSVKLVAVTGLSDEADTTRLRVAGFDAHLVKPLDYDALLKALDRILWMPPKR